MVPSLLFSLTSSLLLLQLLPTSTAQVQCDLEYQYMLGDIAIPSEIDSEPMYMDDYSKILSPEDQAHEDLHRRNRRAAVRDRSRLWPDNTIPYVIDPEFSDYYVRLLTRAMDVWEEKTCIRFVPRTIEDDFVQIKQGRRCCSYVGRQKKGGQKMSLDPGCMKHGILLHEIGHVIGFWHEQNRPDRDEYIKVIPNFHHTVKLNFEKFNESMVSDYGVPYDYKSIMHYGKTFFSIDGRSTTLLPLDEEVVIGQRERLSELDILQANRLYMCNETCSFTYNASKSPGTISSMNWPEGYPPKTDCIKIIYANPGHVIRLVFDHIDVEHHSECNYDFLEVRDGDLPTAPVLGEKFCGYLQQRNFTSSGPALWVKLHTDSSVSRSGFFAHYHAFDKDKTEIKKIDPCDLKVCEHKCSLTNSGVAICTCPLGYELNEDGQTCGDKNECYLNNGGCSHICINNQGGYTCHCPRGFSLGLNRMTCQDIDECSEGSDRCSQLCVNSPGSYQCSCRSGYKLLWDQKTCIANNECLKRNGGCEHTCINNRDGSYRCECDEGYTLDRNRRNCVEINECERNNGGCEHICVNTAGSYRCECDPGYSLDAVYGKNCEDVDECAINNGGCGQKECMNTAGSYYCGCNPGFRLDTASQGCVDNNECEVDNGGCEHECVNTVGSYRCRCRSGYQLEDGYYCRDIDECETMDCGGGQCLNTRGSYRCQCYESFKYRSGACRLDWASFGITDNSVERGVDVSHLLPRHQNPECPESHITEPGPLDSPRYPRNYPPNTTCSWLIQAPPNTRIDITFLYFDLEAVTNCRYDSLTIYDGERESSRRLDKMCDRLDHDVKYRSSGSSMLLKFKSDLVLSKRGFHAVVDMVSDTCGGKYFTDRHSREITWKSRGTANCLWQIEAAEGRYILINFMKFKMSDSRRSSRDDNSEGCSPDEALEIYSTRDSEFLARFCYNQRPPKLYHIYRSSITIIGRGRFRSSNMDILMLHSSTSQYVRYSLTS